jgi:hypothetical protein
MARIATPLAAVAFVAAVAAAPAQADTTLRPAADTSASTPGHARVLRIGPGSHDRAYLRFRVPPLAGPLETATLRLQAAAGRRAGIDVLVLPRRARWSERTLRTVLRGGRRIARTPHVSRGRFEVALDVSRLRTGGTVDLAIAARPCAGCRSPLTLSSREAGHRGPRLILSAAPVVAAAGDIACDPAANHPDATHCRQKETSDLIVGRNADRVLALGDNQYDTATLAAYNAVFGPTWGRLKPIISPVPGNHEYLDPAGGAQGYFDYFNGAGRNAGSAGLRGQGWYEFTLGSWHLIALNSNCAAVGGCAAGSLQEGWFRASLAHSTAQCTLVFWHHPRFSSGNGGNSTDMQQIWQDAVDAHADLVLTGHSHGYEQFDPMNGAGAADPAGVQEIVVGTGGEDFLPMINPMSTSRVRIANTFGILNVTLRRGGYDWRFVAIDGRTLTSGTRSCH